MKTDGKVVEYTKSKSQCQEPVSDFTRAGALKRLDGFLKAAERKLHRVRRDT